MRRPLVLAIARVPLLAFCWITALYSFITSSAFAYLQFIKPRVFHWVGRFSDWHWAESWIWLALLAFVLAPRIRGGQRGCVAARGLLAVAGAAVVANTIAPALPRLHDGPMSATVGVLALLPVLWLGAIDHIVAWPFLASRQTPSSEPERELHDGRIFVASASTALLLVAGYAVLASLSIARAFEPDLLTRGLALGVGASLVSELIVFLAVFTALALIARIGGASLRTQYVVLLVATTMLVALLFARFVGDSVGLSGLRANLAALATGASIAVAWGGLRLVRHARLREPVGIALDVLFAPHAEHGPGSRFALAFVAVLPLAWGFAWVAGRMDWDFAVLRSGVTIVWILTFALVYRATAPRRIPLLLIAGVCSLPLIVHAAWRPDDMQQHVLERYAVHNPSFLLADRLLREQKGSRSFDRFLRANTGLTDVDVKPVAIDYVPSLAPVPAAQRPNVFLFVVDSLRSDYLSPYNAAVHFTPRIDEFAAANVFFPNAFTRYGGTGLSMPAMWAGSALAHKQYVLPFDAMNALEKVLDVNGYKRIDTNDHITDALWRPDDRIVELDRGKDEMDFDFCATLDELGRTLEGGIARNTPVFAQTRSLNLHVASVRNGYVPPGKSYSGFEPPYAYRVERIDGCFGSFIDRLQRLNLYDQSLVVLTADHGELIGEDGRWGHSYHMFPKVIQVPLFLHLPKSARHERLIDPEAVALTTDITPTIYSVLGYQPHGTALAGRSLIDMNSDASAERRRASIVLSASYGAVYAVLSQNGRRLYIADGIHERDYAYERQSLADLHWSEVTVDEGTRAIGELRIRRYIDTVSQTYGLDQPF